MRITCGVGEGVAGAQEDREDDAKAIKAPRVRREILNIYTVK
jgi:hypothetical protein